MEMVAFHFLNVFKLENVRDSHRDNAFLNLLLYLYKCMHISNPYPSRDSQGMCTCRHKIKKNDRIWCVF